MVLKRIIPCLDVKEGRVVKGKSFQGLEYAGEPVKLATKYYEQGADELVFLDITATNERRGTEVMLAAAVAEQVFVPFTVGGGIASFEDASAVLDAGADKVALNSAAVLRPELIGEIAQSYGSQAVVAAIDAKRNENRGREVWINAGTNNTGKDAVAWAMDAVDAGAGEILLTSIDKDGTNSGYDLELTRAVSVAVGVPVIASGGAGGAKDMADAFAIGKADAALLAGMLHYGKTTIQKLKGELVGLGIPVRVA
jgi:cyclase